jgi:hypothetical protein
LKPACELDNCGSRPGMQACPVDDGNGPMGHEGFSKLFCRNG